MDQQRGWQPHRDNPRSRASRFLLPCTSAASARFSPSRCKSPRGRSCRLPRRRIRTASPRTNSADSFLAPQARLLWRVRAFLAAVRGRASVADQVQSASAKRVEPWSAASNFPLSPKKASNVRLFAATIAAPPPRSLFPQKVRNRKAVDIAATVQNCTLSKIKTMTPDPALLGHLECVLRHVGLAP